MATLLITVPDATGHILPILSIAEVLVKRGHCVLVHTHQRNYTKIQAAGADLIPMSEDCDIISRLQNSSASVPSWLPVFLQRFLCFRHEIVAMIPGIVAELETIIEREQVDCLISDNFCFGAAYAAEKQGVPFVTSSSSPIATLNADALPVFFPVPLPPQIVHRVIDFVFPLSRVRQQIGLPSRPRASPAEFFAVWASKLLNLVVIHQEFIPSQRLQENQVFIGPTVFQMPRQTDELHLGASIEPGTILVSGTTTPKLDDGQFRRVLEAIAPMGIPVLATSGNATELPSGLGKNVRLESFVPHDQVLPKVKAVVTHGGAGIVGRALRLGIPMLIISNFGDQLPTGARAAELGLAYHLPNNKATPKAIRAKLRALLEDKALHERLKALSLKLRSLDSPQLAAIAIERVLKNSTATPQITNSRE